MADDQAPSSLDRRRFLTVLGVTAGGGAMALSGCSTDRVAEAGALPGAVGGPGARRRHLVRQHLHRVLHRVRRARAHPRGPGGQARGQPRASDQSGQALLQGPGGAPGPLQSRADQGADGAERRRRLRRDHLGRGDRPPRRQAGRGGQPGRGDQRRAARAPSPTSSAEWTAALGGRLVRYETFDHEPMRAANRQVFGLDQLPAHDFARAQVHHLLRGRLPGELGRADRAAARVRPSRTGSPDGDVAKLVYVAPRRDLTGLNADEWARDQARLRSGAGARDGERARSPSGAAIGPASPAALAPLHPGHGGAGDRAHAPRRSSGWPGSSPRPGRAWRWPAASARSTPASTEVCAAVNVLNFVAGNVGETVRFGAELPTGRRPRRAGASWRRRWTAGEIAVAAGARRQSRLHPAQEQRLRRRGSARSASRSRTSLVSRRDRRALRPAAAPAPRPGAVGRCPAPRRGPWADAAGDGAGVQHAPGRRDPAPGEPQGRRAPWPLHRADLGRRTSRRAGARWPASWARPTPRRSGTRRVAAGRRLSRSAGAAAGLARARPTAQAGATPGRRSRATASSPS